MFRCSFFFGVFFSLSFFVVNVFSPSCGFVDMLLEVKLLWFEDLDSPTATTAEKVSNDVSSFDVSDFKID